MGINYTNLYFPVCSLMISIFIFILFFSKKKIKNDETNNYGSLVVLCLIESFLYTYICFTAHFFLSDKTIWIYEILNKLIYIVYILWFTILFKYVINIIKTKKDKLISRSITIFNIITCALITILDVEIFYDAATGMSNSYGPSSNVLYLAISVYLVAMSVIAIRKINKIEYRSKFIPIYILAIFMFISLIIREVNPFINISSNTLSFVCLVMFFTIENPDVKIVEELVKNKKLLESSFEDKAIYLFKLTNQLKEPAKSLNNLISNCDDLDDNEVITMIEEKTKYLKYILNNTLDISSIDVNNIKINNTVYNPHKFFVDIQKKTEYKVKDNKNIKLNFNTNNNMPDNLYGDSVKLKQVIISLINNAIKYTENGEISINIDCIYRYDICRLIIRIKDTGKGMNLEKINELLMTNESITVEEINKLDNIDVDLKLSLKIIKILGGIINIKSNVGNGTEFTIILDQKVDR